MWYRFNFFVKIIPSLLEKFFENVYHFSDIQGFVLSFTSKKIMSHQKEMVHSTSVS